MTSKQSEPRFHPSSTDLHPIDTSKIDQRNDSDIVEEILSDRPVQPGKNLWAFWDKGWDALQPWRKRNVISWARRLGKDWTIRVLDTVPDSPRNVANFVPHDLLPEAVLENKMTGNLAGQHSADHARLAVLLVHGGVWLDISSLLLRHIDDICWNVISDPNNPHDLTAIRSGALPNTLLANGFIAALPNNPFIKAWHTLFKEIWTKRESCAGVSQTALFDHVPKFEANFIWKAVLGEAVTTEYLNDYWGAAVCTSRICSMDDTESGFNGAEYLRNHCRLVDMADIYPEHALFNPVDGFSESEQIDLLSLPREEPVNQQDAFQARAERLVEGTLSKGVCKIISQGTFLEGTPSLAKHWCHNKDEDVKPGTWAEYLRWGSENLESSTQVPTVPQEAIEKSASEYGQARRIWKVKLLEPIVPDTTQFTDSWGLAKSD